MVGRRHARRLRVVGPARPRRPPGAAPTGCCARAGSGRTATPTRSTWPGSERRTPTTSRSSPRRPRRCGCSGWPEWTVDRFAGQRRDLFELQYAATRLRERSVAPGAGPGARRQRGRVLVAGRPGLVRGDAAGRGGDRRVAGDDGAVDRLRWSQLGDGRGCRRRCRPWPGCCPGSVRSGPWSPARRAGHRAHDRQPGWRWRSATCTSPTPGPSGRSTPGSTSTYDPASRWPSSAPTAPARPRSPSCCAGSTTRPAARSGPTGSTSPGSTPTRGATG